MRCQSCETELPEDAAYCLRCGVKIISPSGLDDIKDPSRPVVVAPLGVMSLRCPSCGAPISPKFGEMMISCRYCGNSIMLSSDGWRNIQKHTMLPIRVVDRTVIESTIHALMNKGVFRWHIWERSTLEEMNLSYVPYWIISVSARTNIVTVDTAAQIANATATAAILGTAAGASRRRRRGPRSMDAAILGGVVAGTLGRGGRSAIRTYQMSENHNYPVVALRAVSEYQPHDFEFALQERQLFDVSKIPKEVRILNGDVGELDAKQQARALVDQLQSKKAHEKYHMIQHLRTEIDIGAAELLHVPVWLSRYRFKGRKKIVLVIDGNSGAPINIVGLNGGARSSA